MQNCQSQREAELQQLYDLSQSECLQLQQENAALQAGKRELESQLQTSKASFELNLKQVKHTFEQEAKYALEHTELQLKQETEFLKNLHVSSVDKLQGKLKTVQNERKYLEAEVRRLQEQLLSCERQLLREQDTGI